MFSDFPEKENWEFQNIFVLMHIEFGFHSSCFFMHTLISSHSTSPPPSDGVDSSLAALSEASLDAHSGESRGSSILAATGSPTKSGA